MISATLVVLVGSAIPGEEAKPNEEYFAKLTSAERTAESQFRLAVWAQKQGMDEVAKGHLRAAVHLDPQFAPAHKALGRSQRSGIWETREERSTRLAKESDLRTERVNWHRLLGDIGVEAAVQRQSLTEAGVAAIEAFASREMKPASEAVRVFAASDLGAASLALVRQAVLSRFAEVRIASSKALAERNTDYVLPALLEYLQPKRFGQTFVAGIGATWYWQEGTTMFVALPAHLDNRTQGFRSVFIPAGPQAGTVGDRIDEGAFARENAVAALQSLTGLKIGAEFSEWRQALMQIDGSFIESKSGAPTSVEITYYQPNTLAIGSVQRFDCFAAGTAVATKRGLMPIDKVCIGELVLSRNVTTGETAFKPVLARTLRPRTPMQTLTIDGESVRASSAHPIWTKESGWVKAKDLSEKVTLVAEDSTRSLARNELGNAEQGYNLVVADFGTYFVGKSRVLVHDNTPIRDIPAKTR